MASKYEYAMYRGDQFLGIGTRKELCRLKGINLNTFSFFQSPTYRSRTKHYKNTIFIVKLGRTDMKLLYSDLKELIVKQYEEYKEFCDDFQKNIENYDQDEFYQQQVIRMQTLKWLLDDVEAMEGNDDDWIQ